jgi:hypothetical protein
MRGGASAPVANYSTLAEDLASHGFVVVGFDAPYRTKSRRGLLMNTSATGLCGDCYGDSGGPKFLETNPGVVYATVTTGNYGCRATSWDFRTDTPTARAFLGQFVALP